MTATRTFPSRAAFERHVYRVLKQSGQVPIRAKYDDAGNCTVCGEAGRCPGWHTISEVNATERRRMAGTLPAAFTPTPQLELSLTLSP
jgi:hypothetical protein